MRCLILLVVLLPAYAAACTTFKVTADGRTLVGCNEDAWSINAQVRFEQGRDGQYGGIYFGHFNGSPLRTMTDQMGMNEAGLVYDGLSIQLDNTPTRPGLRTMPLDDLMLLVMRTCANVRQAADVLRTYGRSVMPKSMLFLADRDGGYLIVENDTLIEGHNPWYAVGNWRMSACSDPNAIPIPRLQAGRSLLAAGIDASSESATSVLESMKACRSRMGEGTLFSALFDPERGQAHLFFYHDFRERITFDLAPELAKGDRTIEMASLFGERPEYDALTAHITPFHQRWLFWTMLAWLVMAMVIGFFSAIRFLRNGFGRIRGRRQGTLLAPLALGLTCLALAALLGVLLMIEAPYYFGLGEVHPHLAWLPTIMLALTFGLFMIARIERCPRWSMAIIALFLVPPHMLLGYWGVLWP